MTSQRREFAWSVAVLILSGAAALGHQVLWTRRMADLIGATSDSTSRVLGCFFLGLSLGAAAAGFLRSKLSRPWRTVGLIELCIALFSLPALLLNAWTTPMLQALGPEMLMSWQGAWAKALLSVAIILPPSFLVGLTLPVITLAWCRQSQLSARVGVWFYAAYTLGCAFGVVVVVGFALNQLGASGSMLLMSGANVIAASLCFARDFRRSPFEERPALEESVPRLSNAPLRVPFLLLLSFFSGAGILGIEVAGMHLLNLKAPLAFYTPGAVLFCVVVLLGCSSAFVAFATRFLKGEIPGLIFSSAMAGLAVSSAPLLFLSATSGQSGIGLHGVGFIGSLLQLGTITCISLGPAVILSGMIFPLLLSCIGWGEAHRSGLTFARLLAVNGLGALLGAEVLNHYLLPSLGVHLTLGAIGACYTLMAVGIAVGTRRIQARQLALPLTSAALVLLLANTSLKRAPMFLRGTSFNLVETRSGREGSLAIVERPDIGRAMFLDNHYMLGCSAGAPDMQRQTHLPLMLHRSPKNVCFIGLGTGITAAGALKHKGVESIVATELSSLVADAAARQFSPFNEGLCANKRVKVYVEDARTYLRSSTERFDAIIGDLFIPWRPGEARLATLEQFSAARAALRSGGVFCQWLPMTQLTRAHFEEVAATFQKVFGETYVFRNHFKTGSLPIGLVGFKESQLDWKDVSDRCEFERQYGMLRDPLCRHKEGIAMLYLGIFRPADKSPIRLNTLDNIHLELETGRYLMSNGPGNYLAATSTAWRELADESLARQDSFQTMPESLRSLPRIGFGISLWQPDENAPKSETSAQQRDLLGSIPGCILSDTDADWSLWPGPDPRAKSR